MKLMIITNAPPSYLAGFYSMRPGLLKSSFAEQKAALDYDAFAWADSWSVAMAPFGYQTMEITPNAIHLQKSWCNENGCLFDMSTAGMRKIVVAQAKQFMPDIVWFNDYDLELLGHLREQIPSLRLVLGWVGSAIPPTNIWRRMDIILSCAPEAVAEMNRSGFPAVHFPHSFDPRVNDRIVNRAKEIALSFVGHLIRSNQFHMQRDILLEQLAADVPLEIFSPSADFGWEDDVKALLKMGLCCGMGILRALGCPDSFLRSLPVVGCAAKWSPHQIRPVNPGLKHFLRSGVFGLKMYQVVSDSVLTLNIHADSSPIYASNMRLYEATGVGTCLVTDWKENIHELFEPDKEVIVYKTAEECREKVKWLLNHPIEAEKIGRAGQVRTIKEYTYARRAGKLQEIIRKALMP